MPTAYNSNTTKKRVMCKNNISRLVMTVLLLVVHAVMKAQPGMIVEHYTQDEGLPSNIVYSSIRDKDGFMWFGTWHGLCAFDGNWFSPYMARQSNASDMPPRKVRDMLEDNDGNLWICDTDNHLFRFNKLTETFHALYKDLKGKARNVQVIKIQLMDNGHLLALTRNKDLFEIYADNAGENHVSKIYDSRRDLDPQTMRLRHNVLGENDKYVYWLGPEYKTDAMRKNSRRRLLPSNGKIYTAFNRTADYICAGTESGDVYIINIADGRREHYAFDGIKSAVSSINIIDGKIYFSTDAGLYVFVRGSKPQPAAKLSATVSKSYVDKYNRLWLCSVSGNIVCYATSVRQAYVFSLPQGRRSNLMKIADTGANGLFLLMPDGEVWHFDHLTHVMQNISQTGKFGPAAVRTKFYDIDVDKEGILWLASTNNGIYKVGFPRNNFKINLQQLLKPEFNGESDGIRAAFQDRSGDLWIGTRSGYVYCIDSRTFAVKHRFDNNEIGIVYHIMQDRDGNLWFSTKGAGLVMAHPDALAQNGLRLMRYKNSSGDKNSISSNRVYHTLQDSKGRIWVCTFGGGLNLLERRGGKTVFFNKRNGFTGYPEYEIYADVRMITEDKNSRLWVGTTDGLMSFDGHFNKPEKIKFETYRDIPNPGITANDISILFKDSGGRIWIGAFGNGLNLLERYDTRKHKPVLTTYPINGSTVDVITAITEDKNRCLWICTENALASLRHGSSFTRSYDMFSGFPDVDIEDNTSLCLRDGRVLIGCRQGLLELNPDEVGRDNDIRHKTFIVGIKVANRDLGEFDPPIYSGSLKYADKIVLPHDLSTFTIEFSSPYFTDKTTTQYAYILDGYEDQWHNGGNNRIASYANVPPGHYKFRVKVNDGISPERVLDVVVSPPWWATWWAYTIYAILIALALYGGIRLALYMIRMRNEVYINDRLAELKIRFFTNVSHELRTPLTLIKGPIDELRTREKLSAEGEEYLELIERNSSKMLKLVNQILDFRKIQNGKMKMHVSLVDITAMTETLMREFRLMAAERNIKFVLDKPESRITAWCDAEKIAIVLNNLINNAFKYTNDGGLIAIELAKADDGETCSIRVEDDGVGIPKSQLEVIFERFSQAGNKTADNINSAGTGIGLSLSKEYIAMHKGSIKAENMAGDKGVAFTVELPTGRENYENSDVEVYFDDNTAATDIDEIKGPVVGTAVVAPQEAQIADRPTVMLIEDNIDMCRMLQLQLKSMYNVFTAHNGTDGLQGVYTHHPDIIITDLMMPGMDGLEFLRCVRQDFNISHIPVIVLTAKNTEEDKMSAVKAGANAYITKPFSSSYLLAKVNQLLEEQRIFQRKMVIQNTVENNNEGYNDEYGRHLVKKDIEFVEKIHEIIERNLNSNDFNIDTIAETIGLSRSAFFKKLKSLTGFAPVDLVKEIRLNKATKLIETTDDSITEIAYSVGFRDAGYFGKCFRKKYGKTPKEYRASLVK